MNNSLLFCLLHSVIASVTLVCPSGSLQICGTPVPSSGLACVACRSGLCDGTAISLPPPQILEMLSPTQKVQAKFTCNHSSDKQDFCSCGPHHVLYAQPPDSAICQHTPGMASILAHAVASIPLFPLPWLCNSSLSRVLHMPSPLRPLPWMDVGHLSPIRKCLGSRPPLLIQLMCSGVRTMAQITWASALHV